MTYEAERLIALAEIDPDKATAYAEQLNPLDLAAVLRDLELEIYYTPTGTAKAHRLRVAYRRVNRLRIFGDWRVSA
jgi:hypothetical protein